MPSNEPPEATRIRGIAIPLVAAALVLGLGGPLTALAVSLTGNTDVKVGTARDSSSRARLAGAVTVEGSATNIGCLPGAPLVLILGDGTDGYSVVIGLPPSAAVGSYPLQPRADAFVVVSRLRPGGQTWTSVGRKGASGVVTIDADHSVSARFGGLETTGTDLSGTVGGSVEARCA